MASLPTPSMVIGTGFLLASTLVLICKPSEEESIASRSSFETLPITRISMARSDVAVLSTELRMMFCKPVNVSSPFFVVIVRETVFALSFVT